MNLFEKIKEKKYNEIINFIEKNPDVNLNLQDSFKNYFIEYVLDSNNLKLIDFILSKDIYIDIIDNNGTTIIYNLIKFNKMDIFKLVIEKNKSNIGINVVDKKDIKGRTSLHYCVIFNNKDAFKFILENQGDPLIKDKSGLNVFFYCIKYERNDFLFHLFNKFYSYKFLNNEGENLLQFAISYSNQKVIDYLVNKTNINLNNQTFEIGLTCLHKLTINNDIENIKFIIKKGADVILSDYIGNNVIHYSLIGNSDELTLFYLDKNLIDLNLPNLEGNTPLHLYLQNINGKINTKILSELISRTNLNIQNNNGDSCIHLFTEQFFKDFKDILKQKTLNIFNPNYQGVSVESKIKNKELLIDLVSESFFNNLTEKKLILSWEKKCSMIRDGKKANFEPKFKNKKDCLEKIKDVIKNEKRSIPKTKEIQFDLNSGIILKDCFFSGFPIDTLFGILWLKKKYQEIDLVLDFPLSLNSTIEKFYDNMGANINFRLDFINSMVLWSYQKIFFPDYFDTILKKTLLKNPTVIIIPIGIETPQGAHTNILFWNCKSNEIERFEPNGRNPPINFNYNDELLDSILINKFKSFKSDIKYIKPKDYLPVIGFQMIENLETEKCKNIGDPNGFCTVWSIWYCYQKMSNLNITSKDLVDQLITNIKLEAKSFKSLIRNFSKNISEYRDDFLKKVGLDINLWIQSNYTEVELIKLEKLIIDLL